MVNLFRNLADDTSSLTAALLTVLEHSDRTLLRAFLTKAQHPLDIGDPGSVSFQYPAPEGPQGAGIISTPETNLTLLALPPGAPPPDETPSILISPTGAGGALSWEEVDRWLAETAAQFDPDSRTNFLITQFRDFLPETGIQYFPGFDEEILMEASTGFATVAEFFNQTGYFFDQLLSALSEGLGECREVRQSQSEDLLNGYCYRDFAVPPLGDHNFLRVAFDLPNSQLNLSVWFVPGDPSHERLGRLLLAPDTTFLAGLRTLTDDPSLRLWSHEVDQLLDLDELEPGAIAADTWDESQVGVQRNQPMESLAGAGLPGRVADLCREMLSTLAPALGDELH